MALFCDVILGGHLSSKYYGYCVQQVQQVQHVPLTDAATRDVSADIALTRWFPFADGGGKGWRLLRCAAPNAHACT